MSRKNIRTQAIDRHVGQQIRWQRIQRSLSQEDLASQLGISYQQLHKYENGSNSVSASRLADIAQALGISVGEFFSGFGDPTSDSWLDENSSLEQLLLAKYYNLIRSAEDRRAILFLMRSLAGEVDGE